MQLTSTNSSIGLIYALKKLLLIQITIVNLDIYQILLKIKMLEKRFSDYKTNIAPRKYGEYWEEAKKSFSIDFKNSRYVSFGERNYLPEIYSTKFEDKSLLKIFSDRKDVYQKLGDQKICLKKDGDNLTLLYANSYYNLIKKYIPEGGVVCEVGSGSGLFSSIIHEKKIQSMY
jgi:hypothetical protein